MVLIGEIGLKCLFSVSLIFPVGSMYPLFVFSCSSSTVIRIGVWSVDLSSRFSSSITWSMFQMFTTSIWCYFVVWTDCWLLYCTCEYALVSTYSTSFLSFLSFIVLCHLSYQLLLLRIFELESSVSRGVLGASYAEIISYFLVKEFLLSSTVSVSSLWILLCFISLMMRIVVYSLVILSKYFEFYFLYYDNVRFSSFD